MSNASRLMNVPYPFTNPATWFKIYNHLPRHLSQPTHLGTQPKNTTGTDREWTLYYYILGVWYLDPQCVELNAEPTFLSPQLIIYANPVIRVSLVLG